MIQPIPLANYEALKILTTLKQNVAVDVQTIVGDGEKPEDWDVIGFTAIERGTLVLLGKRRFGQPPSISA